MILTATLPPKLSSVDRTREECLVGDLIYHFVGDASTTPAGIAWAPLNSSILNLASMSDAAAHPIHNKKIEVEHWPTSLGR
jgi:hypothetical protein